MAEYQPPTENLAIFDSSVFLSGDEPLTYNVAVKKFLKYPSAQGTENLLATNVNGVLTTNADVVFSPTTDIQWDRSDFNYLINDLAAPKAITTGTNNVCLGHNTLHDVTSGISNIAFGRNALAKVTSGSHNIGIGTGAGYQMTDTTGNIAIGANALYATLSSSGSGSNNNIAIGRTALQAASDTTSSNVVVGYGGLGKILNGTGNVSVGHNAYRDISIGGIDFNTTVGYNANLTTTAGVNNTAIGATSSNANFNNSTAIGYGATNTANNQIILGRSTETVSCPGSLSFKMTADDSNTTCYIPFSKVAAGTEGELYVDSVTTPLTYNPSLSTLSVGTGAGGTITTGNFSAGNGSYNTSGNVNGTLYASINSAIISIGDNQTTGALNINTNSRTSGNINIASGTALNGAIFNLMSGNYTGVNGATVNILTGAPTVGKAAMNIMTGTKSVASTLTVGGSANVAVNINSPTTVNSSLAFQMTDDNTNANYYIPFTKSAAGVSGQLYIDSVTGPLTYNPSTSTMTLAAIEAPTPTSPTVLKIGNNLTSGRLDLANNGGATSVWILGGAVGSFCSVRGNLSVQYKINTSTGTSGSPTGKTELGYVFPLITGGWDVIVSNTTAKVLKSFTLDGTNIAYGSYKVDVYINLDTNGASNNNLKFWITSGTGNTSLVSPVCQYYAMASQAGGGCFFSQTISFYASSGSQVFNVCGIASSVKANLTSNVSLEACAISLTRCA
jgi:hypothetical protein